MNINLSLKREKYTITKVSTLILEDITIIYLNSDALHVMKEDTMLEIFLGTKMALKRRRETKEDIMLILQRMMNLPQRESNKNVMILQVMKNMF